MESNIKLIMDSKKRLHEKIEEEMKTFQQYSIISTADTIMGLDDPTNVTALTNILKDLKLDISKLSSTQNLLTQKSIDSDSCDVEKSTKKDSDRPRRKALLDANKTINQQVNVSLITKLRNETEIKIKTERISKASEAENENMPPPTAPAKRGRKKKTAVKTEPITKRSTLTRAAKASMNLDNGESEKESPSVRKMSDVVLIQENIDTIAIDADEEDAAKNFVLVSEESAKRTRSTSSEESASKVGRPKRTKQKKKEAKVSDASVYEDAVNVLPNVLESKNNETQIISDKKKKISQPSVMINRLSKEMLEDYLLKNQNPNATVTISKTVAMNQTVVIDKPGLNNETMIIEKPKVVNSTTEGLSDIMTDDDSYENFPLQLFKTKQVNKQLFSPYTNSPVKMKVQAFEKLGGTTRELRTKTRQDTESKLKTPTAIKTGYHTPSAGNRLIPTLQRNNSNLSESAKKTLSSFKVKNNSKDYEKEAEALRKKEAMLIKQTEEKRRKREEKEKKARQQRELMEKEKQRNQELLKEQRQEKQEKLQQEKLEHLQKVREEAEKRRLLAKQKQEELKREAERKHRIQEQLREEANRLAQQQQVNNVAVQPAKQKPIYMLQKAPYLPTPDCYDSDDENRVKQALPSWNSSESMHLKIRSNSAIDSRLQNTLFCMKPQTPNLQEMMPTVDPQKLRRNSSAIWKKIPRFTMMSEIHEDF